MESTRPTRNIAQSAPLGSTRISQNGYHYTKVGEGNWRLTHHIVAEKNYGRSINEGERVIFKDKDRTNLHPDNIAIVPKAKKTNARLLANLIARRDELNAQILELEAQRESESLEKSTRADSQ